MNKKILALLIIISSTANGMEIPFICCFFAQSNEVQEVVSNPKNKRKKFTEIDTRKALFGNLAPLSNELLERIFIEVLKKNYNPEDPFHGKMLALCNSTFTDAFINKELLNLRIKHGGFNVVTLQSYSYFIRSLLQLNDALFITGSDEKIILWKQNKRGKWIYTTTLNHPGTIVDLTKIDDTSFVSWSTDGTKKIWQQNQDGNWIGKNRANDYNGFANSTIYLDANRSVFVDRGIIRIRQFQQGKWKHITTLIHQKWVRCLMRLNTTMFASGSDTGTIKIWEFKEDRWRCIATLQHTDAISCLVKLNDNSFASGSVDGTVNIWHIKTIQEILKKEECKSVSYFKKATTLCSGLIGWL